MKNRMRSCLAALAAGIMITGCAFTMNPGKRFYDNEKGIAGQTNSYNLTNNTVSGSAEKMEGMDTIWNYTSPDDTEVTLSWKLSVSSGKAKLVLIDPDGNLSTLVECEASAGGEQNGSGTFEIKKKRERTGLNWSGRRKHPWSLNLPQTRETYIHRAKMEIKGQNIM